MEGPDQPNARNIKKCLNDALNLKYEASMEYVSRDFTIVTDGAFVKGRVLNAFILSEIHAASETWLKCMYHALNNVMKSVLESYCNSTIVEVVVRDLRSNKTVIEDAKRVGWNYLLPNDCRLIQ